MPITNSTATRLTKDGFWSALCDAAHQGSIDLVGGLVRSADGWRVDTELEGEIKAVADIFCPLLGPLPSNRPLVVGHLAQSLDGCIAQADGESHWISGDDDLDHTHRLRAFCDAVLVGAETVARDDCQLTVRRVDGPHPLRIVLDPRARLGSDRKMFHVPEGTTIWVVGENSQPKEPLPELVEVVRLPCEDGHFEMSLLLALLHQRGCRRLFVEGGGVTISHFLKAGVLDRLHIAMAPVLIGGGRPTIGRALGATLSDCPRPSVRVRSMGTDWLFDCDFQTTTS